MMKDPRVYADHILRSILQLEEYTAGYNRDNFSKEKMRYDAILRNLQTMAESTQRLPENLKGQYPQVPWKDISGFRNVLVHDYLGDLDDDVVWSIIVNELNPIKKAMKEMLQK
jgi:uncharacterized protein with HEPN domain